MKELSIDGDIANVRQALNDFTQTDFDVFDKALQAAERALVADQIDNDALGPFLVRYLRVIAQHAHMERKRSKWA